MELPRFAVALGSIILLAGAAAAHAKPTLLPYAGSYTGTALSTTADGALSGSSTLTFTGRKTSLRGTFLYNGILNSGNVMRNTTQTFNISKTGLLNGRVTVDGLEGAGSGQARMRGRKLAVSVTYAVGPAPSTTIAIVGTIVFKGKRATWTGTVTSPDPGYNGSLLVTGKR